VCHLLDIDIILANLYYKEQRQWKNFLTQGGMTIEIAIWGVFVPKT
jgi:hypothetical protein